MMIDEAKELRHELRERNLWDHQDVYFCEAC
jgi:hypothetical protein